MANKKISELQSRTPALSDLMLVGDPSSGYSYKCTVTALATIIETDIADGYVTIGTTQTISGAKTFSNNLTLTSVVNTPTDPDKFLTLNASNVVTYRTGAEVLSDIGGVGGSGTTNYLPKFSATTTLANSQIFDNGTNIGIATATPDATARVQINKTDGYGLYLNYNTSTGSGVTTTALYAINTTASSGYAAVIEEKTPNTTAGQYPFVIKHSLSSGTAGVGFGTGVHFQLLDDAGTSKTTQLTIENIDAAAATYKTRYRFNVQNNGSSTPVVYINGTGLGVFTASPSVALDVTGEGKFSTINNATTDTDKFLVSDSGVLKYRTGAEVLSDIGGQGALTLTTSGSSGAATLVGNTLNIPNYGSALSGYVPYTGATTNVNLGTRYLQANYLVVDGQSNATGINFKQYSSVSFNGDGYTAMGPVSVDKMFFNFAQGSNIFKIFYFDVSGITGNATRAYTMPNSDGTLALTSQIPTVSGTTNYIPKFTSSSAIGNSQIFDNGTSIGIGTTSPAATAKLEVIGDYRQKALVGNANGFNLTINSVTDVVSLTNFYNAAMTFATNNTERMRLDASGNLLLGTTSGSSKMTIATADATSTTRNALSITDESQASLLISLANERVNIVAGGNDALVFGTNSTERLRVDASGNLGLGTSSADGKLDIAQAMTNGSTSAFTTPHLALTATSTTDNTGFVGMTFATSDNANYGYSYGALRSSGGLGDLIWRQHYNSAQGTELMRLSYSGNLGLGVSPSAWSVLRGLQNGRANLVGYVSNAEGAWLTNNAFYNGTSWTYQTSAQATMYQQLSGVQSWHIAPSGTAGSAISFTQAMTLNASGNLGLGTTTPLDVANYQGLSINGTNGSFISLYSGATQHARLEVNTGTEVQIKSITSIPIIFGTNNTERMRITSGGNVGIGTTSITNKLTVIGSQTGTQITTVPIGKFVNTGNEFSKLIIGSDNSNYDAVMSMDNNATLANTKLRIYIGNGTNPTAGHSNDQIVLQGNGNVGIGTTSPVSKFQTKFDDLTGTGQLREVVLQAQANGNNNSLNSLVGVTFTTSFSAYGGGNLNRTSGVYGINTDNTEYGRSMGLVFYTSSTDALATEKMRITSGGYILTPQNTATLFGAQTATSSGNGSDLTIKAGGGFGAGNSSGNLYLASGRGGSSANSGFIAFGRANSTDITGLDAEYMRITSGGDILVAGTYNPFTAANRGNITLNGTSGNVIGFANGTAPRGFIFHDGTNLEIANSLSNPILFATGGSERARLTSSGELLINTTSDAGDYKLQVNGAIRIESSGSSLTSATGFHYVDKGVTANYAGFLFEGVSASDMFFGRKANADDLVISTGNTGSPTEVILFKQNANVEIPNGSIKTAAPSGGTAKPWKLGEAGVTLGGSNTSGVRVEIDGVVYYLVTGYLP